VSLKAGGIVDNCVINMIQNILMLLDYANFLIIFNYLYFQCI